MDRLSETEKQNRAQVRKILYNLETKTDVMDSLVEFKQIALRSNDDDLIVLVLQKIHNILHDSYDIRYIAAIIEVVHTEKAIDELFKIFFSFEDREDFADIIIGLKERRKMALFKYLRELKDNHLLAKLVSELEMEFYDILSTIP